MSASEIIRAYEAGLITKNEAIEQAQVDSVDALYQRIGNERSNGRYGRAGHAFGEARH